MVRVGVWVAVLGGARTAESQPIIAHVPPEEMLQQDPLPLYVEVAPGIPVGGVEVFYKGLGMQEYARQAMHHVGAGWGVEVECMAVFPPRVAYYIVVLDPAGQPFSYAGSPTEPIVVPVVTTRTREPPHLPGRPPPPSCGRCDLLDYAEGRCGGPSVCRDQICGWDEHTSCPADCTPSSRTPPVLPSLWIAAGVGVGAAVARDETVVNPDAGAGARCADGAPAEECVDVPGGTALVPPAAHLAGGYFVKDWLSVDAALRWAIVAEDRSGADGDFLRWELEARLGLWSRRSVSSDLWFHFFAGLGYGSIQPEIAAEARDGSQVTIFETSGPASASVGGGILWHLGDPGGLALVAEYDAYYFFPATLPGIELWVGAAYGLGG